MEARILTVRTMGMVFNAVPEFAYLNLVRSIIILYTTIII